MSLMDEGTPTEAPVEEAPVEEGSIDTTKVAPDESPAVDAPLKPEWLDEQFWDTKEAAPKYESLAKSYTDLRAEFNKRNNDKVGETVEEYADEEFMASEGMEGMKEDPAFNMAIKAAQEAGLGVKQAQSFIAKFMEGMGEFAPEAIDTTAELAKLGKNGPHVISGLKTWIDGMKTQGDFTDEVHGELVRLGSTAAGIKALDVLRQKSGEMNIPAGDALTGTTHMSSEDWYSASYETHAEAGESRDAFDVRMHELGKTIFGTGHGTFSGEGLGTGVRR